MLELKPGHSLAQRTMPSAATTRAFDPSDRAARIAFHSPVKRCYGPGGPSSEDNEVRRRCVAHPLHGTSARTRSTHAVDDTHHEHDVAPHEFTGRERVERPMSTHMGGWTLVRGEIVQPIERVEEQDADENGTGSLPV